MSMPTPIRECFNATYTKRQCSYEDEDAIITPENLAAIWFCLFHALVEDRRAARLFIIFRAQPASACRLRDEHAQRVCYVTIVIVILALRQRPLSFLHAG